MKVHDLKCWPPFFAGAVTGLKRFELRVDDRGFQVGDILRLREWFPERQEYSGSCVEVKVTWIARPTNRVPGLVEGWCILGWEQPLHMTREEHNPQGQGCCVPES